MSSVSRIVTALAATSIAALTIFAASCSSAPAAQEIVLKAISATQGVTSLKTAIGLSATTETTGGKQPGTTDMTISGSGIVDVSGKKSSLALEMTVNPPGEAPQTLSTNIFVVGDWEYVNSAQSPGWRKIKLSAGTTRPDSQLQQQGLLLRTASTAVSAGQEKIDGIQCYVLTLTPDVNALWQWFLYQGGAAGLKQPQLGSLDLTKAAKDVRLKVWVDTGKFLVRKVQVSMTVEFGLADISAPSSNFTSASFVLSGDISLIDYNIPVDIRLPPDALNATDITGKTTGP
ncbi:MAG: hypothetical protein Q7T05_02615 [Dehalococcoidia bacterium]|nr:hypothetical protein [Dehalococcoidia bacterium]